MSDCDRCGQSPSHCRCDLCSDEMVYQPTSEGTFGAVVASIGALSRLDPMKEDRWSPARNVPKMFDRTLDRVKATP